MDILKELLSQLFQGANAVIATIALTVISFYSWWVFANQKDQKKARKIVAFGCLVGLVAGLAMLVQQRLAIAASSFSPGQTGVLVLRIVGPDDKFDVQNALVHQLRLEFEKVRSTNHVSVHAA